VPLPRLVARLNKRYTNRFIEPVVRRFSSFACVVHFGRRSGAEYQTPVYLFDCDGALLVALTYGAAADWVLNVLAGGAAIKRGNQEFAVEATSVVGRDIAWPCLPAVVRGWLRALRVDDFMLLRVGEAR
jgi:deazaflavin-dependent oxidoreductase (nitroreductase family)